MDKLLLTPTEAAAALGIGRSKVYELIRAGTLGSVRIDTCRRIPAAELEALVDRLRANHSGSAVLPAQGRTAAGTGQASTGRWPSTDPPGRTPPGRPGSCAARTRPHAPTAVGGKEHHDEQARSKR